ncbi:LysR family transcriptional regulator [Vibrio tapetis subsp. quintayensis]|uniref:LysR family transcriptional regulator n=1 Tax=Vibrio tapetis TaxID=52443 RepID=UPI0025B400C8|nr:LysR family transcriptional regulator [Vibrio tapetis]MDN3680961.1 LysR family transcriptional regulator [Vibrio tapetis subsp. quintayensis]
MVKPELLKCFIAAADTGSFSAAGRKIGKHLATVSGNIARLEDELGVLLFDRDGKYPQLTDAGLNLYDSAKVIVDSVERFTLSATQLSAGIPATFTIAIDEDLNLLRFASILKTCQQKWPHLRISVMIDKATQIFEGVRQQEIDFAVVPSLEGNSQFYEFKAVGHSAVYIICAKQHALAKKRVVSNDDLMSHTQIISSGVEENKTLYQVTQMSPSVWFANGHQAILQLVAAGIGWAFINAEKAQLPSDTYVLAPEFAETHMQIQYDVIWPKNQPMTDVHVFFLEQIKTLFLSHK